LNIKIDIKDELSPIFHKMYVSFPKISNFIISKVAKEYAEDVKKNYLSGQVLKNPTDETKDSVKFYKLKRGHFQVRPGCGIKGSLNYLSIFETGGEITAENHPYLRFEVDGRFVSVKKVYIPPKPFMSKSYKAFANSGKPSQIANRTIDKMLRKWGLK